MNIMAYVILGLCLVSGAAGVYGYVEHRHVASLTQTLNVAEQQIKVDGTALTQEKATETALAAAVDEWKTQCVPATQAQAAATQVAQLQTQLTAARQRLAAQETQDEKLPACAAVLGQNLDAACPDVASGLRQLPAAGDDIRGPPGAGAGAGGAAAAPGAPH
jgi:hypothetical protein